MDHCSTCRRTLNGALVCPGCGAYAPDIDPWRAVAEARAAERAAQARQIAAWRDGAKESPGAEPDTAPPEGADEAPSGSGPAALAPGPGTASTTEPTAGSDSGPAPEAASGAASASDGPAVTPETGEDAVEPQPARRRRNRRRAAAATALAFLGGGLTLAAVVADSPKGAASSSAPDPTATSAGTTSGPAGPSSTWPAATTTRATPARHSATANDPYYGPVVPGRRSAAPLRTSSGSVIDDTGTPSSPTAGSTGSTGSTGAVSPTPTSTVPSASPTSTPKHRVCVLALCFD